MKRWHWKLIALSSLVCAAVLAALLVRSMRPHVDDVVDVILSATVDGPTLVLERLSVRSPGLSSSDRYVMKNSGLGFYRVSCGSPTGVPSAIWSYDFIAPGKGAKIQLARVSPTEVAVCAGDRPFLFIDTFLITPDQSGSGPNSVSVRTNFFWHLAPLEGFELKQGSDLEKSVVKK